MQTIGFVAKKESGKSTSFNFIKELIPGAEELMLAEHLKRVCSQVFNIPYEDFQSKVEKERILKELIVLTKEDVLAIANAFEIEIPAKSIESHVGKEITSKRELLQYVGTEVARAVDDEIHLKWALKLAPKEAKVYVVTDIRFPNEYDFFAGKPGFVSVYITRSKATDDDATAAHASERSIESLGQRCEISIKNDGTLEYLRQQITEKIIPKIKNN